MKPTFSPQKSRQKQVRKMSSGPKMQVGALLVTSADLAFREKKPTEARVK